MGLERLLFRNSGGVSKMKLGGIVGTLGGILVTVGSMLEGKVDFITGLQALGPLVGALLVVVGWRDAISGVRK